MLTVTAQANFDVVLGAYSACPEGPGEDGPDVLSNLLVCSDGPERLDEEEIVIPVESGGSYWAVVDGYRAGDFGNFTLTATLSED
jgi:hypothetical protein